MSKCLSALSIPPDATRTLYCMNQAKTHAGSDSCGTRYFKPKIYALAVIVLSMANIPLYVLKGV